MSVAAGQAVKAVETEPVRDSLNLFAVAAGQAVKAVETQTCLLRFAAGLSVAAGQAVKAVETLLARPG